MGVGFCVVFAVWFASGLVMVFHRMPEYSASERLARLPLIDPASIHTTPEEAFRSLGLEDPPARVVLTTLRGRPVYRFLAFGEWHSMYADDGREVEEVTPAMAVSIARNLFGARAARARYLDTIDTPDQWAFEIRFRRTGPLHRLALGDGRGTVVYVAQSTGEVVLLTDRASRLWAYAGAIPHWFYFRPLRARGVVWANTIIYGSLAGLLMALAGLVIGLYRFSMSRRFKGGTSASPYVGWLRWHHYAGLVFGVIVLTWTFSGMLSMTPWDWSPGNGPDPDQIEAIRGEGIFLAGFTHGAADAVRATHVGARDVEFQEFLGTPYFRLSGDGRSALVRADTGEMRDGFTRDELMAAARAAMPGVRPIDSTWLTTFDAYYYGRGNDRDLPVLRVRYADPDATWLYLDSRDGSVVQKEVKRSRLERWLYHGFHSLDFPGLYQSPWAWYPLILILCAGGLALSLTSLVMGWRVLRRF